MIRHANLSSGQATKNRVTGISNSTDISGSGTKLVSITPYVSLTSQNYGSYANLITNNNQLTNGANYVTSSHTHEYLQTGSNTLSFQHTNELNTSYDGYLHVQWDRGSLNLVNSKLI